MNGGEANQPQFNSPHQPPALARAPTPAGPKPFSTAVLITCAVLALGLFYFRNWPYLTRGRGAQLYYPGTSASWALHVEMLLHDGANKLPRGARGFLSLLGIKTDDAPEYCEELLRDTIAHLDPSTDDPTTVDHLRASLVILLAERGAMTNALEELALLPHTDLTARFRQSFTAAYVTNSRSLLPVGEPPEGELLTGWAHWRLKARWLQASEQRAELKTFEASIALGEYQLLRPWIALFACGGVLQLAGLVSLIALLAKTPFRRQNLPAGPAWSAKEYWGLFLIGTLLGMVAEFLVLYLPFFGTLAWLSYGLVLGLPTVILLGWRHWWRDPEAFAQFIGFPTRLEAASWLTVATLALFSVSWLSLVWASAGLEAIGFKSHWAESFDEVSFTWPWAAVLIHLFDGVIFAPVMEELVFRGLLFSALRKTLSLYPAAALSGLIFGGAHFYGLPGFLGVSLFGFWCAVAREKTGSLIPPILAHVLINLILLVPQAAMGLLSR